METYQKSFEWYECYVSVIKNLVADGGKIDDPNVHAAASTLADVFCGKGKCENPLMKGPSVLPPEETKAESFHVSTNVKELPEYIPLIEDHRSFGIKSNILQKPHRDMIITEPPPVRVIKSEISSVVSPKDIIDIDGKKYFVTSYGSQKCTNSKCSRPGTNHSTAACGKKIPCQKCRNIGVGIWTNHTESDCSRKVFECCWYCVFHNASKSKLRHTSDACRYLRKFEQREYSRDDWNLNL